MGSLEKVGQKIVHGEIPKSGVNQPIFTLIYDTGNKYGISLVATSSNDSFGLNKDRNWTSRWHSLNLAIVASTSLRYESELLSVRDSSDSFSVFADANSVRRLCGWSIITVKVEIIMYLSG